MVVHETEDEEEYGIVLDLLDEVSPNLGPGEETVSASSPSEQETDPHGKQRDPGMTVLVQNLGPNYTDLHYSHSIIGDTEMTDQIDAEAQETSGTQGRAQPSTHWSENSVKPGIRPSPSPTDTVYDINALRAKATAGLREEEVASQAKGAPGDALEDRHDSGQHGMSQPPLDKRDSRFGRTSPSLEVKTTQEISKSEETIATSPTLSKHVMLPERGTETLPALQSTSSTRDGNSGSPQAEKLPPIRQLVPTAQFGQLPELAEAASQQLHHHSPSFGSTTSQSPMCQHYSANVQTSPSSQYAYVTRSPTSAFDDHPSHTYGSPTQYCNTAAYYPDPRRPPVPTDHSHLPPSLPSASSSIDSAGPSGSSVDGYSTSHTTPIDGPDGTPRPTLPLPHSLSASTVLMSTGFNCDHPGCGSTSFQTQYLLNSHKNVHSQNRPHYCSVPECPRSEGGQGFKRKNEMIRHRLVHESPGYICPFCPDREHRYPRPDNLQRHVRVHHVDKDKDDPQLRDVLAQRIGTGKQRRRRADTGGSAD